MHTETRILAHSVAILGLLSSIATGCRGLPEEGDPCDSVNESICESGSGPGIYACLGGEYVYLHCANDLCQPDADRPARRWAGTCGMGDEHDVCFCSSSTGGGGGGGYRLTCHDDRTGYEQCVHYTFDTQSERDSFYDACAGLTSRTRDAHNCPSGATGSAYCRHTTSSRMSDTFTYNGTAAELESRCASTSGTWVRL